MMNYFLKYKFETQNIEFKKTLAELSAGMKTISAFLNTRDGEGIVCFGANNNGDIIGLSGNIDNQQKKIRDKINQDIFPIINPILQAEIVEDKTIVLVKVKRFEGLVYSSREKFYIRVGTSNVRLNDEEIKKLKQIRINERYSDTEISFIKENSEKQTVISTRTHFELERILEDKLINRISNGSYTNGSQAFEKYEILDKCRIIKANLL